MDYYNEREDYGTTDMKIEVELRLDDTNQWFAKITDILGYSTD